MALLKCLDKLGLQVGDELIRVGVHCDPDPIGVEVTDYLRLLRVGPES